MDINANEKHLSEDAGYASCLFCFIFYAQGLPGLEAPQSSEPVPPPSAQNKKAKDKNQATWD